MSKVQIILMILQTALAGLGTINPITGDVKLIAAFVGIIQHAMAAYHAETGKAIDLTLIPLETPVP